MSPQEYAAALDAAVADGTVEAVLLDAGVDVIEGSLDVDSAPVPGTIEAELADACDCADFVKHKDYMGCVKDVLSAAEDAGEITKLREKQLKAQADDTLCGNLAAVNAVLQDTCPCDGFAKHKDYVKCVKKEAKSLRHAGDISKDQEKRLKEVAKDTLCSDLDGIAEEVEGACVCSSFTSNDDYMECVEDILDDMEDSGYITKDDEKQLKGHFKEKWCGYGDNGKKEQEDDEDEDEDDEDEDEDDEDEVEEGDQGDSFASGVVGVRGAGVGATGGATSAAAGGGGSAVPSSASASSSVASGTANSGLATVAVSAAVGAATTVLVIVAVLVVMALLRRRRSSATRVHAAAPAVTTDGRKHAYASSPVHSVMSPNSDVTVAF